jgi:hypothetical protein
MIDGAGNPGSDLGQEQKNMAGLKQLMGSPPPLDNWISYSNTYVNK